MMRGGSVRRRYDLLDYQFKKYCNSNYVEIFHLVMLKTVFCILQYIE